MQVKSLSIERRPSYDSEYPNQLVGMVELDGVTGSQKIRLTNERLSRVFSVITDQVVTTARANAAEVKQGLGEALHEPLLAKAATTPELV